MKAADNSGATAKDCAPVALFDGCQDVAGQGRLCFCKTDYCNGAVSMAKTSALMAFSVIMLAYFLRQ